MVGLSSAVALVQAGHRVTVLEPDRQRRAPSWNNAGHIAVEQVAPLASLATIGSAWRRRFAAGGALDLPVSAWRTWLPFGLAMIRAARPRRFSAGSAALRSLLVEAMPAWQRAATAWGAPGIVRAAGHLVAWESRAATTNGLKSWSNADTGAATVVAADTADHARIAALVSDRRRIAGAARFTGSGQIHDLADLADALEAALRAHGGQIVREAASLRIVDNRALVPGHNADLVVVAAGIASGTLLSAIGHVVPIVAERGYHIRTTAHDWPADMPPLVFEDRSMIVTRYADTVQAASFVEIARADAPPDPRKWDRLERHVAELGLPMRPPFTRWMGARPTLPDYLPVIGRSRRAGNLIYAFGHQHLGLTLAPITAELVAALAADQRSPIDLTPFDLARFGGNT